MSQRGPAPRPASRRSSPSPTKDVASSPNSQPGQGLSRQDDSNILPQHDPGGRALTGIDGRRQSRTSGVQVHDILNPPEPQRDSSTSSGLRPGIKEESPPLSAMGPGQHGSETSPSLYYTYPPPAQQQQQHHHHQQQQSNPAIPPPAIPPPLARGSPHITAARRILTPRSPRAASLSRAASRVVEPQHIASFSPNTPRGVAPPPHDISPLSGSPATGESYLIAGPIRGHGTPAPPPNRLTSGLSRSLSQPMLSHGIPTPRQDALQSHGLGRGPGPLPTTYPPAPPFTPPIPSGGALAGQGLIGEWRWGSGPLAPGQTGGGAGPRSLQVAEGHQHLITITPDHGEKILVPVNTHEGSKQMNEKRQRNAGASARFRHRKKIKDQAMMEEMQKLEAQNRELQQRVKELEEERDFYMQGGRPGEFRPRSRPVEERAERGPSSPVSSRSGGEYTGENSPLPATSAPSAPPAPHSNTFPHTRSHALNHPHPPPMSYGDPSMLERPARRRRIDSAPELATLSHSSSPPGSLPPLPPPGYGIPPSPHLAEQSGTARLPPLRYDQPGSSTPTPPPVPSGAPPPPVPQQQQQHQQQHRPGGYSYPPYTTASYETGWASEYKGQPESRPR